VVAADQGRAVNYVELGVSGAWLIESPVWADERGFFREWFRLPDFLARDVDFTAQQANISHSVRNTVRGLHYSLAPEGQAKLVTCASGALDDVLVDIRVGSPTFGVVEVVHLAGDAGRSVYLPAGVAHGFCVTSESAVLAYLLSSNFNAPFELEINPFDTEVGVAWALEGPAIVSGKDASAPTLAERRAAAELPRYVA
jgi:dTDP-4-dehydrorhamnose 3,5-epimerase